MHNKEPQVIVISRAMLYGAETVISWFREVKASKFIIAYLALPSFLCFCATLTPIRQRELNYGQVCTKLNVYWRFRAQNTIGHKRKVYKNECSPCEPSIFVPGLCALKFQHSAEPRNPPLRIIAESLFRSLSQPLNMNVLRLYQRCFQYSSCKSTTLIRPIAIG